MLDRLLEELMTKAGYLSKTDLNAVREAFDYGRAAHRGQRRKSGEPFFAHPVATALILAAMMLDACTLVAALLHDVVEDTEISVKDIEDRFGVVVARLVDGVTKLTAAELAAVGTSGGRQAAQAATIRKFMMYMADDVRVALIKLADRLHNMSTIQYLPAAKRIEKSLETMEIYVPVAQMLGLRNIYRGLEDMSFQQLYPTECKEISRRRDSTRAERDKYIRGHLRTLERVLDEAELQAEVFGRLKRPYSIHIEISNANKAVDYIHDSFTLTALVDSDANCYEALRVVHSRWRPAPGEFRDYIADPKDNGYQSLHTTVIVDDGHPVEIQVRTWEMHRLAEHGVAAHWLYGDGGDEEDPFKRNMNRLLAILGQDMDDPEEWVEALKTEAFAKESVFVYTPDRDVKELPAGSMPLDFAFSVHSDLILECIGAKANEKLVPLTYQLQNGDTCEILTSNEASGPSLDWLNEDIGYIATPSARARVRRWFKRQERSVSIQRGRDLYARRIRRLTTATDAQVAAMMGIGRLDDFLAALGDGSVSVARVVNKLDECDRASSPDVSGAGIEVLGAGDLPTSIAGCCNPANGDEIIGYLTRSRGVTVHRRDCRNILKADDPQRLAPLSWGKPEATRPVRIQARALDRVGLLSDVTGEVSAENVNIQSCLSEEHGDVSIISLTVHVSGLDQLSRLFFRLEAIRGVTAVARSDQ